MKKTIILSLSAFVLALILHVSYFVVHAKEIAERWTTTGEANYLVRYFARSEYLMGASYALAIGFSVFALMRFIEDRKRGVGGLVGGITLSGILSVAGCFLLGCCGSPMLAVYVALFGSWFIGFTKPLTFVLTLTSVVAGYFWMERKSVSEAGCCEGGEECPPATGRQNELDPKPLERIEGELREGMALPKCRKCGCMGETLEALGNAFSAVETLPTDRLRGLLANWQTAMEPTKYSCLGCQYCFPAVAMNLFNEAYPDATPNVALSCAFEVKEHRWPAVAGEYQVLCENGDCPVAVSTLGSPELADKLAAMRPEAVCIVGKTETENIGIDKIIKNTVTNRAIRYLVLAGSDPKGHYPGQTLLSLSANGVDKDMRVIGSLGRRPILRNVTVGEIKSFREQVQVVDMIGVEEVEALMERLKALPLNAKRSCTCAECNEGDSVTQTPEVPILQAKEPSGIQMDKAGYFVVLPNAGKGTILVEHYGYDDTLLRTLEGRTARSLYWTIIEGNWVTQLTHSAYLGKELAKAELSLKYGFKYVQDGA